jgi:hypothetical protein
MKRAHKQRKRKRAEEKASWMKAIEDMETRTLSEDDSMWESPPTPPIFSASEVEGERTKKKEVNENARLSWDNWRNDRLRLLLWFVQSEFLGIDRCSYVPSRAINRNFLMDIAKKNPRLIIPFPSSFLFLIVILNNKCQIKRSTSFEGTRETGLPHEWLGEMYRA